MLDYDVNLAAPLPLRIGDVAGTETVQRRQDLFQEPVNEVFPLPTLR